MSVVGEALANAAQAAVDRHITGSHGQETALRFADKRYTFHDLAALTNRVGNMLKRLSAVPGQYVIVAVPESPAFIATVLGAIKISAIPVVLTGAVDAAVLAKVRAAAKPALLVIHQSNLAALGAGADPGEVVVVGNDPGGHKSFVELVREEPSSLQAARTAPDAAALAWFDGAAVKTMPHGALVEAMASGSGAPGAPKVLAQINTLAAGGEVALG